MPGVGEPREQFALVEERFHKADIHQMRTTQIRIIDDVQVSRRQVFRSLNDGLRAKLHRAYKYWKP